MNEALNPAALQMLSALADGEASDTETAAACTAWPRDAQLRQRWHAWHLIGDVLRSEEMGGGLGDAAFLNALRPRLEAEPVVLAPTASPAASHRQASRRWAAAGAVAAGFVVVAGALTVLGGPQQGAPASAPQLAKAPIPMQARPELMGPVAVSEEPQPNLRDAAATGLLIRNARLDQYLAAHKQFGGGSGLGVPAGFLRNATFESTGVAPGAAR